MAKPHRKHQWIFRVFDEGKCEEIARLAGMSPVVAQILAGRDQIPLQQIQSFLDSPLMDLRAPESLGNVPAAAQLILEHVREQKRICIYGDYDADGMTATAVLYRCLTLLNANVGYFLPNRLDDGYGLNNQAIEQLAQDGVELIVSVDCGITSLEQVTLAKSLGMKIVVTDHHTMKSELPQADAIVHPQHPDQPYPFEGLCGAGVAFKLAWAVCQLHSGAERVSPQLKSFLMLALGITAIGTVADVVPLLDENRILVKHGLRALKDRPVVGIAELMRITKLDQKPSLGADDIGFTLAPRLNASGRLGQAQLGVELLTTDDPKRAKDLAEYIHHLNDSRDSLERSILKQARQQIKDEHWEDESALVLAGRGWHAGVIGIVAARIAEQYHRPTIIISLDQMHTKPGTGSARSALGINLYDAIEQCQDHLLGFGGHRAAAGLRINEDQIATFREEFNRIVTEQYSPEERTSELQIDAEVPLSQLTIQTLKELGQLAPFGHEHPQPLLCASEVELSGEPKRMGKGDLHFSCQLQQHGIRLRAVAFGKGDWVDELQQATGPFDFVFRAKINEFNGRRSVELHLVDWQTSRERIESENSLPGTNKLETSVGINPDAR